MRDPSGPWDETTDRRLLVFLEGSEWSALFYEVLGCARAEPFNSQDNVDEWREKHRLKFQKSIPDYPFLLRIWDTYIDVSYRPQEISSLKIECERLKATTSNRLATRALDKLIYACQEASIADLGLLLSSD